MLVGAWPGAGGEGQPGALRWAGGGPQERPRRLTLPSPASLCPSLLFTSLTTPDPDPATPSQPGRRDASQYLDLSHTPHICTFGHYKVWVWRWRIVGSLREEEQARRESSSRESVCPCRPDDVWCRGVSTRLSLFISSTGCIHYNMPYALYQFPLFPQCLVVKCTNYFCLSEFIGHYHYAGCIYFALVFLRK